MRRRFQHRTEKPQPGRNRREGRQAAPATTPKPAQFRATANEADRYGDFELDIAAGVISRVDAQHPADAVLRTELRGRRDVSPESKRFVARAVFAYYRWLGWLNPGADLRDEIGRAVQLQADFARAPRQIPAADLFARTVPHWLKDWMPVDADWVRAIQCEPTIWLRARPEGGPDLARTLGSCIARPEPCLRDCLEYRGVKDLLVSPEFHQGRFEIQDIGSQLIGCLCQPAPGETWWDACAGEGGKLLHLADLMRNQGLVWATDAAEWRLDTLRRRAARARLFNYRAKTWDGGAKLPVKTRFDGVLVDAPCTGIGTWQRNPHARWTLTPEEIVRLAALQLRLLEHAAAAVKPGGRLVYSVCTLTDAETIEIAAEFRRRCPEFEPWLQPNPLKPNEVASEVFFWPQRTGGNGMFAAGWKRKAN